VNVSGLFPEQIQVESMPESPGEIRLVHGEPEAQRALKSKLDTLF
jgi:hypothetical protein